MKKILSVTLCSSFLFGALALAAVAKPAAPAYKESTADAMNEVVGMKKQAVRRVVGDSTTAVSKTYAQYGVYEGKYVIRFATAVKGDLESVSYFRKIGDGALEEKPVSEVYKGIAAEDKVYYYDGNDITEDDSFAGQYYWACYTIAFSDESKWDTKVSAYLSVKAKGVDAPFISDSRDASVNSELPKLGHASQDYIGDQIELRINNSDTGAELVFGGRTIHANVTGIARYDRNDPVYALKNMETKEEFEVAFHYSTAYVYNIKYLKNDADTVLTEDQKSKTEGYYATLQVYMTSFTVKVGSLTANADGKYDVFEGESIYLSLANAYPSNANVKTLSYHSLDESKATVEETEDSKYGLVSFLVAGEVTIRVEDAHNANVYKDVTFVIAEKVYPTEDNWSITSDKTMEEVDGVQTIKIVEGETIHVTAKLDEKITHNKEVTYRNSDTAEDYVSIENSIHGTIKGISAGSATITLSVKDKDGKALEKSVKIIVEKASADAVPTDIVGTWSGFDNYSYVDLTFEVKSNKAEASILSNGTANFEFYYKSSEDHGYYVNYIFENSNGVILTLCYYGENSSNANELALKETGDGEIYEAFMEACIEHVEISKQ